MSNKSITFPYYFIRQELDDTFIWNKRYADKKFMDLDDKIEINSGCYIILNHSSICR